MTIHEGRFHQVKRMLQAVDNQVLTLERVSFGPLSLDLSLQRGEYRALTEEEIKVLSGIWKEIINKGVIFHAIQKNVYH